MQALILEQGTNVIQQLQQQIKPTVKAVMKMVEKEQAVLIQKIGKYHDPNVIKAITNYQQEKSVLMKLLEIPSGQRTKKQMKNIKAEISYLKCFQTHLYDQDIPKEVLAIMKRDLDMLTAIIAKYVHARTYKKSTIIEATGTDRKKIRVLLKGQIAVFQPINYKSYKNCVKLLQTRKYENVLMKTLQSYLDFNVHYDQEEEEYNNLISTINPEQLQVNQWQDMHNQAKTMSVQFAKKLLKKVNLIGPTTPHRLSRHLKVQGSLLCSDQHHYIVNQKLIHEHTAICLADCYVLQLQYQVYRQAIAHLNSDQQKKFIQTLLKRFQKMDYFDAKQYVKKEFLIDKKMEQKEKKQRQKIMPRPFTQIQKNISSFQGRPLKVYEDSDDQDQKEEKAKNRKKQTEMETFEIKYDNDLYLIAQGEVTLQVDIIHQTRLSSIEQASKVRLGHPKQILKLYQGDLFGFEQIGKVKQYNLRYIVNKSSKILLMSQDVYIKHYYEIEGFKDSVKFIQGQRNQIVNQIIQKLQRNVQEDQFKKYKSVATLERPTPFQSPNSNHKNHQHQQFTLSSMLPPKQLQFVGNKKFQNEEKKLKLNIVKEKQGQQKVISLKELANERLNLKDSLAFASLYKNTLPKNCKIVNDFVEIRNNKGALLRRRSISNADNYPNPDPSRIFRRIGVVNDDERNEHNLNIIQNRKSKYQLEDFRKQKKEFQRIKDMAASLPKLGYLYAKKEELLYKNLNKLNYRKY